MKKKNNKNKSGEFKLKLSDSSVYVEGLPTEITKTEVAEYFQKCGLVFRDLSTSSSSGVVGVGEYKVKIYKEEGGDTTNPNNPNNNPTSSMKDTNTTSNTTTYTTTTTSSMKDTNTTSNTTTYTTTTTSSMKDTNTTTTNTSNTNTTTSAAEPKTVAALVTYYRVESVQLALDLLDGSVLKYKDGNSYELKVTRADYSKSSNTSCKDKDTTTTTTTAAVDSNQSKRRMTKAELKKQVQFIQRQLDWNDHNNQEKIKKKKKSCLILKNLFSVKDLEKNPELLLEIKEDVLQECEKYGKVLKVDVQESSVYVRFRNGKDDDDKVIEECIKVFNGRYFDGRIVEATSGDYDEVKSSTSYSSAAAVLMVDEDLEEESRLKRYSEYLNNLPDSEDSDSDSDDVTQKDVKRIRI
jgi:hypothetical protein